MDWDRDEVLAAKVVLKPEIKNKIELSIKHLPIIIYFYSLLTNKAQRCMSNFYTLPMTLL